MSETLTAKLKGPGLEPFRTAQTALPSQNLTGYNLTAGYSNGNYPGFIKFFYDYCMLPDE